jgi:glycosyltransferase involved in cell wall biosynthesis
VKKLRVCVIYDVHLDTPKGRLEWAYARRASALKKYAPPDFTVNTFQFSEMKWDQAADYDIIFNLEYTAAIRGRVAHYAPRIPIVYSFNSGSNRKASLWPMVKAEADWIIFNNLEAFDASGRPAGTCCISNGIDSDLWNRYVPIGEREHRAIWTGSPNPAKGKRYREVLLPLVELAKPEGFDVWLRPVSQVRADQVFTTEETACWYNSASYVLMASVSEGTPNYLLEAAACGAVPICTRTGNVLEFGGDGFNCIFAEPTPESFLAALIKARENREEMSEAAATTMRERWSYGEPGERAAWFFQLFRRLISDGAGKIDPFSYHQKHWSNI